MPPFESDLDYDDYYVRQRPLPPCSTCGAPVTFDFDGGECVACAEQRERERQAQIKAQQPPQQGAA